MNYHAKIFEPAQELTWPYYYLYGIERLAAIANIQKIGSHDWYQTGAAYLVKTQRDDGSWPETSTTLTANTPFGILFLVRATNKMLGRIQPVLGTGLLAGGRGLPGNLKSVLEADGKVQSKPIGGSLDDLLSRLENPADTQVPAVQQAILETVRFGDRASLIGERERLKKLAKHTNPEVRRTVYWALGRSGDILDAPLLIDAIASDEDLDAAVEAHNALCVLSLQPNAFGVDSGNPTDGFEELATDSLRAAALKDWRQQLSGQWRKWYRQVAPYNELEGRGPFRLPR